MKPSNHNVQSRLGEIHIISGGPIYGGSVNIAKVSYKEFRQQVNLNECMQWRKPPVMSTMSFTVEDVEHVIFPHDDSLVVTLYTEEVHKHTFLLHFRETNYRPRAFEARPLSGDRVHESINDS